MIRRSGFSLIETALAVAVVGVGILGVIGLFPTGLEMNRRSLRDTLSTQFAAVVMEGLQAEMAHRKGFGGLGDITIPLQTPLWSATPSHITFRTSPELARIADAADPTIRIADIWYRLDWIPVHRLDGRQVDFYDQSLPPPAPMEHGFRIREIPHPQMKRARLVLWVGADTDRSTINTAHNTSEPTSATPDLRASLRVGYTFAGRRVYRNYSAVFYYQDFYQYE